MSKTFFKSQLFKQNNTKINTKDIEMGFNVLPNKE